MNRIGRDEELNWLEDQLEEHPGANLVLHGVKETGKSFLLDALMDRLDSSQYLCIKNTQKHPFASCTSFFKAWIESLLLPEFSLLSKEQQADLEQRCTEKLGSHFQLDEWVSNHSNPYHEDGYIFLQVLKLVQQSSNRQVVLILDQAENLSAEGREILRLILEWKPDKTSFLFALSTLEKGKPGIEKQFGIHFYFKANRYLELDKLPEVLHSVYLEQFGLEGSQYSNCVIPFVESSKRLWLLNQLENHPGLRELFALLALFPGGLDQDLLQEEGNLVALCEENPQIQVFLRVERGKVFLFQGEVIDLIHEKLADQIETLGTYEKASEWSSKQSMEPWDRFLFELTTLGEAQNQTLSELIHVYRQSGSLLNLLELCEASLDANSQCQDSIQEHLDLLKLLLFFNKDGAEESLRWFHSLPQEKRELFFGLIYTAFKQNDSLPMFLDSLQDSGNFPRKAMDLWNLCFDKALAYDDPQLSFIQKSKQTLPEVLVNSISESLQSFTEEEPAAPSEDLKNTFPSFACYMEALVDMHNSNYKAASDKLREGYYQCLQHQTLRFIPQLLTRMAECQYQLDDMDQQIEIYKEAVISQQFLN